MWLDSEDASYDDNLKDLKEKHQKCLSWKILDDMFPVLKKSAGKGYFGAFSNGIKLKKTKIPEQLIDVDILYKPVALEISKKISALGFRWAAFFCWKILSRIFL